MKRKTFTMNDICLTFLYKIAKQKQISQAEVLRRAIEHYGEYLESRESKDGKQSKS